MSDLAAFYQARIAHCRKMADAAENERVRDIHEELIAFYRGRLAAMTFAAQNAMNSKSGLSSAPPFSFPGFDTKPPRKAD
ncbi:hypothetical protein C1T17_16865 [Sphingobium sp. SCG-1]|uniref:hypothetical protein n=1 Tax=Sphingobium sp. SCG-1 TaxID=2072936 RepID=UPI000CD6B2A2|nr:hypothetical protein [Sphingobium sp. SCG-1]AUW59499.1 hypothetical protein C1T17_16865 [Sphingobium sp. SCG-1]